MLSIGAFHLKYNEVLCLFSPPCLKWSITNSLVEHIKDGKSTPEMQVASDV